MINIFITNDENKLSEISHAQKGCWIEVTDLTDEEAALLVENYKINRSFLKAALDDQETAHLEQSEDQTLIMIDCCISSDREKNNIPQYETAPISLILFDSFFMTITRKGAQFLNALKENEEEPIDTRDPVSFFLILMKQISEKFQEELRTISSYCDEITDHLFKKMKNEGLMQMMKLDKSLIFFSSSLQANQNLLEKIQETRPFELSGPNEKLLDEDLVEYRQASKMCNLYISVNERISDGCSNILSNSMNIVVERLTIITIVLSIPAIIFGFYGMNVKSLNLQHAWLPIFLALGGSILCWIIFYRKRR